VINYKNEMAHIKKYGYRFDRNIPDIDWLNEHIGPQLSKYDTFNPKGYWKKNSVGVAKYWLSTKKRFRALTGDTRKFDAIDLVTGDGWYVITTINVVSEKGGGDTSRFETTVIIDDELLALQYKLAV
jgi:hypothetical protein